MSRKPRVIFTDKEQSDRGIMSVILGIICVISLVFGIGYSYSTEGALITARFGAAMILSLVFSCVGLALGISARNQADKFTFIPTLGIVLNSITVIALGAILWIGLN